MDVMSGGRVAWNIVTSATELEARNVGGSLPRREERYDRADEVLEACCALWNSWDADAFILDKEKGLFADPDKVHYVDYDGKWVKTRGPFRHREARKGGRSSCRPAAPTADATSPRVGPRRSSPISAASPR